MFRFIFTTSGGFVNYVLTGLGLPAPSWLGSPFLAFCVAVLANCWFLVPFATLILLGGLQTVDKDIYEAAKLDGASGTKTFFRITLPLIKPMMGVSVCRKTPFLEFEPASAVKFDPDLTGGFGVKWTWSATFGGKRRAGGDFGAHIGDFRKYRAWRAAGSPVRAALAGFPGDVRQLFVAGT